MLPALLSNGLPNRSMHRLVIVFVAFEASIYAGQDARYRKIGKLTVHTEMEEFV